MNWKRWRKGAFYLVILALLILVPTLTSNMYYLGIANNILINVLLAVSMWVILNTGQVTLGHAGFAAIGAYISAAVVVSLGAPSWLAMLAGVAASAVMAAILGFITLRIKGLYFMLTTLALGSVITLVFSMFDKPFGGVIGLLNVPPPSAIGPIEFSAKPTLYYLTLALVVVGIIILNRLDRSAFGRIFRGISQASGLAEHVGINIMSYKVLAFVIGSAFAGLAGVLYTYLTACILPASFTLAQSTTYLVYVAVGGAANIAGPILGTAVFSALSEVLKPIKSFEPIIYGLVLICVVLTFRSGLLGLVQLIWRKLLQTFSRRKVLPAKEGLQNMPREN